MKKGLLIALLMSFTLAVNAQEVWHQKLNFENFGEAKNSSQSIRFEVFSTKVGLFTTRVPGYVLKAEAKAEQSGDELSNLRLVMKADSFDTDSEGRDEKLHGLCLETEKYPEVEVVIPGPALIGSEQEYPAIIKIRGSEKSIRVKTKLIREGEKIAASGEALLGLKELEIPDPSIAIATLENKINVIFKLVVEKKSKEFL